MRWKSVRPLELHTLEGVDHIERKCLGGSLQFGELFLLEALCFSKVLKVIQYVLNFTSLLI